MDNLGGHPLPHYVLSAEEAEERIGPFRERLNQCIREAWDAWQGDYKQKHHILSNRTRAAIVFDEIKARALVSFAGIDGCVLSPSSTTLMLYIGDDIALRFKKMRKDGRSSNIKTKTQRLFDLQLGIPGIKPGTLVHAGYMLDDVGQNIVSTLVVCQFRARVVWSLELANSDGELYEFVPTPEPVEPITPRWELTNEKQAEAQKAEEKEQAGDASS